MKSSLISITSKQIVLALLVSGFVGHALESEASAQRPSAQRRTNWQYQPAKQPLSPYLNLLQTNFGPVPNYYSLVRPRLAQDSFNQQVKANERAQSLRIQQISEQETQEQPVSRTGKSAGFMEYLHYFPAMSPRFPAMSPRPAVAPRR
jgi:hypothetical protein